MLTPLLIAAAVGYLLGALPFGYLVARAKGVNIFEVGSKNPGATNVRRVLGSGPGNLVLVLDALKGAMSSGWPLFFLPAEQQLNAGITGVVAAILGHSFSCFTGFRGGKSVATGAGGFLIIFPIGMAIAFGLFVLSLLTTRYVSLGSMLGAISLPITAIVLQRPLVLIVVSSIIAVFVLLRHRANISRLLAGTESKIGQRAASVSPAVPKS